MINYRERPRCRKALLLIVEKYDSNLWELYRFRYHLSYSDGMVTQLRKMMDESGIEWRDIRGDLKESEYQYFKEKFIDRRVSK